MKLSIGMRRGLFTRIVATAAPAVLLTATLSGCGYDDRYDDRPVRVERRVERVERVEREPVYREREVVADEQPMLEPQPVETTTVVEEAYTPPPAEVVTTYETELRPYGEWVEVREYGRCWVPRSRPHGWRPYTVGRWQYSEQREWVWVSEGDESDWGVVTYHYGRWYDDPRHGWVWVPGTTWAPAWVSWREGGGYCGWAPLPPRIRDGYRVNAVVVDRYVPADRYVFVEQRYLGQPRVHQHVVQNNVTIINQTTNITNITYVNNRVVNRGVQVEHVERASGRRIEPVRTVQVSNREQAKTLASQGKPVIFEPPVIRKAAVQVQQTVKVQEKQRTQTVRNNNSSTNNNPKNPNKNDPTPPKIRPDGQISTVEARQIQQQREAEEKQQAERERLAKERDRERSKAAQNDPRFRQAPQNQPKINQPNNIVQGEPRNPREPISPKTNPPRINNNVNPKIDQNDEKRRLQVQQQQQQHELELRKQQEQELLKRKQQQQDALRKQQAQEEQDRKQQQQDNIRRQQLMQQQHDQELQRQAQLKKPQQDRDQELQRDAMLKKKQQQDEDNARRNRDNQPPKVIQQNGPQPKVVQQNNNQPPNVKNPRDPRDKSKDPNVKDRD